MKALLSLLLCCAASAAEPIAWDFETGPVKWRPRTATLTVRRDAAVAHGGKASLHVAGTIDRNWNYAISDNHPLREGRLYRLSAWMRVNRIGEATPMPYMKCEFVPAKGRPDLGRASTNRYDLATPGTWQRLSVEFRAPAGVRRCWVAVEKGTSGACELDLHLDDVVIEPIEEFTAFVRYRLKPLPEPLAAMRGKHPRLYLDAAGFARLKRAAGGTHAAIAAELRAFTDRRMKGGPPKYRGKPDRSGNEQLWQRNVGNTMPYLAMAWRMTGERKYLDAAKAWAMASCAYPTWGLGRTDGMDLAAGHQLFGLAIVYDWCHEDLDAATRKTIRDTLIRRATKMFEAAANGTIWWHRSYLQNHLWVNITGLAAAGFAIFDEHEAADRWVGLALAKFRTTMASLGPDGASHEGVGYWGYGVEYMLKFMHLARQLLGVDLYDNDWWRNTAAYRLYLGLPRNAWTKRNSIVDIADCPRTNWYGPEYLLRRLAAEYRDGHAQWLARQVDDADVNSPSAGWLNLLWYDPTVKPTPPTALPTLRHFEDMGLVSIRTGWAGDESLLVFKCGPYIGHHAIRKFSDDPGGGHVHPDANHFVLFGAGEWLIRDDGYQAKWTHNHNTLLIDGVGQMGEGRMWLAGAQLARMNVAPTIVTAGRLGGSPSAIGDAADAYPKAAGLKRFRRQVILLQPNAMLVVDSVAVDRVRELELRFHPEYEAARTADGAYVATGKRAVLRLELLTGEGVAVDAGWRSGKSIPGERPPARLFTIAMKTRRATWRNIVALSWAPKGQQPPRVTMERGPDPPRFHIDGKPWEHPLLTPKAISNDAP